MDAVDVVKLLESARVRVWDSKRGATPIPLSHGIHIVGHSGFIRLSVTIAQASGFAGACEIGANPTHADFDSQKRVWASSESAWEYLRPRLRKYLMDAEMTIPEWAE